MRRSISRILTLTQALRGEVRKEKKLGKMMDELADDRMRIKKQLEIDQYKKVRVRVMVIACLNSMA